MKPIARFLRFGTQRELMLNRGLTHLTMGTTEAMKKKSLKDDYDFELPKFNSPEDFEAWWKSLPNEDAEVDERLNQRVSMTMNLSKLLVDGFQYLAQQQGVGDAKTLMYVVLNQYLNDHLPEDF